MENFHSASLILHIVAGIISLLTGLLAILFRKKTAIHKPIGKIYFWCMTIIFFTGIFGSLYRNNLFLFCVAFFTYYACITAYRSLQLKKLHLDQKPLILDWAIEVFFGIVHLGFLVLAIILFYKKDTSFAIVSLVFSAFGLRNNYVTIRRLRGQLKHKNYWLLAHIGGMCGSYIGAITAFMVNNNRWLHLPDIITWLGPTLILVPFLIFEIRNHQKKGGLLKPQR